MVQYLRSFVVALIYFIILFECNENMNLQSFHIYFHFLGKINYSVKQYITFNGYFIFYLDS